MSDNWPDNALSCDDFLGGRLRIRQPLAGYRAGMDPVLLAASVAAEAGQSVLDLGCGAGVAALCLGARVPGLGLVGLERQAPYAALARRNAMDNDIPLEVVEGDLAALPATLRQRRFDHVIANPPYFTGHARTAAMDTGREASRSGDTPLGTWVRAAARRTLPGGSATFIQRADRLPDLLRAAQDCLGSLEVLPLVPRRGRATRLVLLRGRKGGRAAFRLHDGWLLHEGAHHDGDRDSHTVATGRVLREAAPLPFG
ncbi:tRNA1(Val) (adenine(37)-N6)-methyltransferase [Roseovarius sp. SYSU LYC5161]|uniref:tRNA1(Val) (adenine(37)-N6)-methyltransferase n=1 Tax=Roseovarius halophilus (ex Wu et al. 2025) TaxID=3376060 RepID=UPI002870E043|nr:methyltransferase [Roseovarius sp.]